MKHRIAVGAMILMLMAAGVQAASFPNRGSRPPYAGIVQKGDEQISFAREEIKARPGFTIELQYVQRPTEEPYGLIHIWATDAYDTVAIVSPSGKSLTLTEDPSLRTNGANPQVDRWYRVDMKELVQLDDPDECDIKLHRPNGKYFTVSAKRILKQARQVTGQTLPTDEVQQQKPYGPSYSVFFPNTSWQTVRNAMAYYLNPRQDAMPEHIYRRGDAKYLIHPVLPFLVFYTTGQAGHGIARYTESAGGTWVDMDFWRTWSDQYGYHELNEADDEVVNIGMNAAQHAYTALVPHQDYGLTVNGGLNKTGPTIDTIDTTNHPELSAVAHSDKVISINGIPMADQKNFVVSYMLTYGTKPLTMVLQNGKNQQYTVVVEPKSVQPRYEHADFQGAVESEKKLHLNPKNFMSSWPLSVPGFEVFDPVQNKDGHVDSPVTGPLDKALQ